VDTTGRLEEVPLGTGWLDVFPQAVPAFKTVGTVASAVKQMLEICLPLCLGAVSNDLVVAHLGQSLDGQIATASGASCFITGQEDLKHTHRLRALCDAVVVGRSTVAYDNPKLTTRLVSGDNPTRVILDPGLRTPRDRHVFQDGAADTLLLCGRRAEAGEAQRGNAVIAELPCETQILSPELILQELRRRGLRRVFIEGGGVTVSHFLQAGLLDRIHVVVSPVFLGQGRPGATLPKIDGLENALRPRVRRFSLGEDVLFDCELRS
jgi:riboflavin-specific deaminase-like protein